MVAAPEGLWVPARKPDGQRVLYVTGAGKHSGLYVEIVADHDQPTLRKLDETSCSWSNSLAIFSSSRWRITSDITASKCWLRSQKLASFQLDASAWEKRQGKGWIPQPEVSCRWGFASELETKLRALARKALQGKLRLTLFRCTAPDCPKGCGNTLAKDWGLPSLADLLGHLTYYHRGSSQYHEKVNEAWNQQLADELEQQEEDGEELLSMFKASLNKHNYELKTKTLNVAHHVNNIRKIVQKRGCEVSRSLANDQEVYDEVWQWQEEKSGHGRLTVSLRWLKKFTEVNALEVAVQAAVAQSTADVKRRRLDDGQEPVPSMAPEAAQIEVECTAEPQKEVEPASCKPDPMDEDPLSPKLRPIARAVDPVECILHLFYASHRASSAARMTRDPPCPASGGCGVAEPHELANAFAKVAAGDREFALLVAKVEESGPCRELLAGDASAAEALSESELLHAWLWAYTGVVSRRAEVLEILCVSALRRCGDLRSLNGVFQKLLLVALSPLGAACDVLPAVLALTWGPLEEANPNDLSIKKLDFFAKKGFQFHELLGQRGSGFSCGCVQFASFGGLLGGIVGGTLVRRHLQQFGTFRPDTTFQAWLYRMSFLTALLWNCSPSTALEDMEKVLSSPVASVGVGEQQQLRIVQQRAREQRCKMEPQGLALPEERPVATPTRTRNSSPGPAPPTAERPATPRKLEEALEKEAGDPSPSPKHSVLRSIRNVDTLGLLDGVKGQIRRRVVHANVSGFQLTLHDETGQIHVKFWEAAAEQYKTDPRLEEGAVVFLSGYSLQKLDTREQDYAPAGRRHCLSYKAAEAVQVQLLRGVPIVSVAEASTQPVNSRLSLRCYVARVEELVEKGPWKRRKVWVSDGPGGIQMPWTLWAQMAKDYGDKVLGHSYILAKNVKVSQFRGQKQLSGCSEIST